jgi:hypothetical protein
MTKLHQLNALITGKAAALKSPLDKAYHTFQSDEPFKGQLRNYRPLDDSAEVNADAKREFPDENKRVQATVDDVIDSFRPLWESFLDATLQQDTTNAIAKASIKIGNTVIVSDAPVTWLLRFEHQVQELLTVVKKLPVYAEGDIFTYDKENRRWVGQANKTFRTIKVPQRIIKWEPTPGNDKHPAQVEVYMADVPVGTWTTTALSGALSPARKRELIERATTLLEATRYAREEANTATVVDAKAGKSVFDYLLK